MTIKVDKSKEFIESGMKLISEYPTQIPKKEKKKEDETRNQRSNGDVILCEMECSTGIKALQPYS